LQRHYNPLHWHEIDELESGMTESTDFRTFVRVIERGGFAAASKDLGVTASAVSKLITRLEDRLGVRLLHRTTRRLALTPEGETYYLRARDILTAIDDAEAEVSRAGQRPRGRLRVNCVAAFAFHQLAPSLIDFHARYPEIELELAVTDRVVDLLVENADVGIRSGAAGDPSLVARKFGEIRRCLFASPGYLARRGTPVVPEQLRDHNCIVLKLSSSSHRWQFRDHGEIRDIEVRSPIVVDSGEAALRLTLAGGGICRLADLVAAEALGEGSLKPVLPKAMWPNRCRSRQSIRKAGIACQRCAPFSTFSPSASVTAHGGKIPVPLRVRRSAEGHSWQIACAFGRLAFRSTSGGILCAGLFSFKSTRLPGAGVAGGALGQRRNPPFWGESSR
jgi:DNA-binding transcriptional LysR family regulator